jgi:hypothetical protein
VIVLHIAKNASEWRQFCIERDNYSCQAEKHHPNCAAGPLVVHHAVYRSHLSPRSTWVCENGVTLADACHKLAHATHNVSLGLKRANECVVAVNCLEQYAVSKFTRKAA